MQRNEKWDHPFEILIEMAKAEMDKNKPPSILQTSEDMSDLALKHEAKYNVWSLMIDGLKTLKADARDTERCGDLTLARAKMSMRNSELAKTLSDLPPRYPRQADEFLVKDREVNERLAHDLIKNMIEGGYGDLKESRDTMVDAINAARIRDQNMPEAGPQLQQVFMQVMRGREEEVENLLYGAVHRQMACMLREMTSAYKEVLDNMHDQIERMIANDKQPTQNRFPRSRRNSMYNR